MGKGLRGRLGLGQKLRDGVNFVQRLQSGRLRLVSGLRLHAGRSGVALHPRQAHNRASSLICALDARGSRGGGSRGGSIGGGGSRGVLIRVHFLHDIFFSVPYEWHACVLVPIISQGSFYLLELKKFFF